MSNDHSHFAINRLWYLMYAYAYPIAGSAEEVAGLFKQSTLINIISSWKPSQYLFQTSGSCCLSALIMVSCCACIAITSYCAIYMFCHGVLASGERSHCCGIAIFYQGLGVLLKRLQDDET